MAVKKKSIKSEDNHAQAAYEGIRKILFTNEIEPGQKISYRQLAEHLGMSLTPVIQALKRLEFQGLVKYEANRGYSTEPMSMQEVQEIYETRELLETSLLPDVIANLNEDGIVKLQKLLENQPKPGDEAYMNERIVRDREFHLTLAGLSGRKIQVELLKYLFDLLYIKYGASLLFMDSDEPVGSQHQSIFNAVLSRDTEEAGKAYREHFNRIKHQALKALGKMIAEKSCANGKIPSLKKGRTAKKKSGTTGS